MTPEQFASTRLKVKLNFNESEAARHVLCNGMSVKQAALVMLVDEKHLAEIIALFNEQEK